jgi:hypothetical protein
MTSSDPSKALLMQHFLHIIILRHNAIPIWHVNVMAHPLLALKQL